MDISISRRLWRHKVVRRGLTYSLILVVVILVIGGIGFWMLDPKVNTMEDGLWLSFTTAATVGYGDMVPSTPWSRAFAVLVVLLGLSVLSLVTASLAAIFVEKDVVEDERRVDAELLREVRRLRMEVEALSNQLKQNATSNPSKKIT
jgi:voltage-gated potassium channel